MSSCIFFFNFISLSNSIPNFPSYHPPPICNYVYNKTFPFILFPGKRMFDRIANLKSHISKVHYKQVKVCNFCGGEFSVDDKSFKRHQDKCAGITYQCEHCPYKSVVQVSKLSFTFLSVYLTNKPFIQQFVCQNIDRSKCELF